MTTDSPASNKVILMPLPAFGADPTEVSIPWQLLREANIDVVFATPDAKQAELDPLMLHGKRLGIFKPILKTRADAVQACLEMSNSNAFRKPISYAQINAQDYDGLLLPGGHDKGVKPYLESEVLQGVVVESFDLKKPVAAICHGVVLAARSTKTAMINGESVEQSVIHDFKTTALLENQELTAYQMTRWWLGDYYLTYPGLTVQAEVSAALASEDQFATGPQPLLRDDMEHLNRGFTVVDRNFITARWPGDVYNFALAFIEMLTTESSLN